jgi:hypothetical protein
LICADGAAQRRRLDEKYQGSFGNAGSTNYLSAVDIAPMGDVYYRPHTGLVIDPINYPVGATDHV